MIKRAVALVFLSWAMGFIWFSITLPRPIDGGKTDAAIALTGGEGRITRGLSTLRNGWTSQLLVAGVDKSVKPREFVAFHDIDPNLMSCCITLDFKSIDTRSNAREGSRWIAEKKVKSVRLITSDWHMRRAALEFQRMNPPGVTMIEDAVATQPSLHTLFMEYNKYLARFVSGLWG